MITVISLIRGINVGGHHQIKMDDLRKIYGSLGLRECKTYVQSGNVLCQCEKSEFSGLAKRIQDAIEKKVGFRPDVIVRSHAEMQGVVKSNPFARHKGLEPAKLVVTFLAVNPSKETIA